MLTVVINEGNHHQGTTVLTSLPFCTHLLQGRLVSQARCFFLQFTHADGTCAFALRAIPGGPGINCASEASCALAARSSDQSEVPFVVALPGGLDVPEVSVLLGVLSSLLAPLAKALFRWRAAA